MTMRFRARRPALAGLVGALLALAGCGFQPVHAPAPDAGQDAGQGTAAGAVSGEAAAVRVRPIPNRIGQILHTALSGRLMPDGTRAAARYNLAVTLDESERETGFRLDETATRRNFRLAARYRLTQPETGRILLQGRVQTTNSANILDQPYATEIAERDARERGARDLAAKIARDVSSALTTTK